MDSLISPSNSLSLLLPNNLIFDANLLDLKSLLKLQSVALPDLAATLNLPKEIITSPDELNSTLQSLLSNEPNSKKNDFDHRLSKLHEIEQINKAGLYNVLRQTAIKTQNSDSPGTRGNVFPPRQATPSTKRRPDEQHELSPKEEVYIRKKMKPGSDVSDSKTQALNIVLTQPPPQKIENSPKLSSGLFSQALCKNNTSPSSVAENNKDMPQNVLTFKLDDNNNKEFLYLVEWKPRKDGSCLNNSYLSRCEIMKIDPNLLVNFYEDQMLKLMSALK